MADNNSSGSKDIKKAEAAAKALQKALQSVSGEIEKQNTGWSSMSNAVLGISQSDFFKKGPGDIAALTGKLNELKEAASAASSTFNADFKKAITGNIKSLKGLAKGFTDTTPEIKKALMKALDTKNFSAFLDQFGDEGLKAFTKITDQLQKKGGITDFLKDGDKNLKKINNEIGITEKEIESAGTKTISWSKALSKMGENFAENISPQKIVNTMMQFDKSLSNIQRKFSVLGSDNIASASKSMSELNSNGAQFGVSIEDNFKSMEELGDAIKTTDINSLAPLAQSLQAIPGALGIAREEVNGIAGSMKFMGSSTESIKAEFSDIAISSKIYGVNVSKVGAELNKILPKVQRMGFKESNADLAKMVAHAEKLGISLDSIVSATDKFQMGMDESLEAASSLQLVGGKFANSNPFDIMAAAQSGPKAYTKMVEGMVAGIGKLNKDGDFTIDPVDRKRLKMASEALGLSVDDMVNISKAGAQKAQKLDFLPPSLFTGMDEDSKEFLLNSTDATTKKVTIDGKVYGVNELSKLSPTLIKSALDSTKANAADLAKRNKQNQSLKESFDSLINSFLNVFTMFEPLLKGLGYVLNNITAAFSVIGTKFDEWFGGGSKWIKGISALTAALLLSIGPKGLMKLPMALLGGAKNFAGGGIKGLMGGGGGSGAISSEVGGIKGLMGGGGGSGAISSEVGGVASKGTSMLEGIGTKLKSVAGILKTLVGIVTETFVSLMKALGEGIVAFFKPMKAFIADPEIALGMIVFTASMIGLGYAFKLFGEGLGAAAPGITAILNGVGTIVKDIGTSIATVITAISASILQLSNIPGANLYVLAGGVGALAVAMGAFGAGSAMAGIGSAIGNLFGGDMFEKLSKISMLAVPISLVAQSINEMASGMERLATSMTALDVGKFEKLADISERLSVASALSGIAGAIGNLAGVSEEKQQTTKIELAPIQIDLKMNGRDLQTLIINDSKLLT